MTEPCEGPGTCHGCMKWCDECGDVDQVCDWDGCNQHEPCVFPGCDRVGYGGLCSRHQDYDEVSTVESVMTT